MHSKEAFHYTSSRSTTTHWAIDRTPCVEYAVETRIFCIFQQLFERLIGGELLRCCPSSAFAEARGSVNGQHLLHADIPIFTIRILNPFMSNITINHLCGQFAYDEYIKGGDLYNIYTTRGFLKNTRYRYLGEAQRRA